MDQEHMFLSIVPPQPLLHTYFDEGDELKDQTALDDGWIDPVLDDLDGPPSRAELEDVEASVRQRSNLLRKARTLLADETERRKERGEYTVPLSKLEYPADDADHRSLPEDDATVEEGYSERAVFQQIRNVLQRLREVHGKWMKKVQHEICAQREFRPVSKVEVMFWHNRITAICRAERVRIMQLAKWHKEFFHRQFDFHPKRRSENQFSEETHRVLSTWFFEHITKPYPDEVELERLCTATNLKEKQIKDWCMNRRSRGWRQLTECICGADAALPEDISFNEHDLSPSEDSS
ncbi:Pre-B-cell leukemia transcription factor 4 [Porphyridium purpureum]|uniref:Pre-B-cell leukemia transcription factor 4 n=1 Tax=Porphyridium purpureum TaxID=35688 RepID=A0A5J4YLY5_PORPP|nr:Pre-B-cell leukemia transcription factor 4 [Porphyridium purpureum]|eukprot:POR3934..scf244_11